MGPVASADPRAWDGIALDSLTESGLTAAEAERDAAEAASEAAAVAEQQEMQRRETYQVAAANDYPGVKSVVLWPVPGQDVDNIGWHVMGDENSNDSGFYVDCGFHPGEYALPDSDPPWNRTERCKLPSHTPVNFYCISDDGSGWGGAKLIVRWHPVEGGGLRRKELCGGFSDGDTWKEQVTFD